MARQAAGYTKRADGRIVTTFSINGKRYSVYGKTVKECREKEARKRQEIEEGIYKAGKNQTMREFADRWLENKRGTVKETTLRNNRILLSMVMQTAIDGAGTPFGGLKLGAVEVQNVRDLQTGLSSRNSTRTTNDCISLVRGLFKAAIIEQLITFNPAAGVRSLKRTEDAARDTIHRALTRAETAAFMTQASEQNSLYCNLYTFLLNTGCRIGEAAALTAKDISKGQARISRTITRTENGGYRIGDDTKTAAGRRTIPLTDEAQRAITEQRRINTMLHGEVIEFDKPIFRPIRGAVLKDSCVNEDIARICKAAGIERFTVHAFRDTFATRCVESGMQPKTLQEIMGHTDINMTMALYAHAMDETKTEQLKAVNFG